MTEGNEAVNEMKQLEGMCAAVPPPDEDTLARARVRVLSVAGDTASGGTGRGRLVPRGLGRGGLAPRRLITVPRLALTSGLRGAGVLAAGLGLTAAAVAVVVASGAGAPVGRPGSAAAAQLSAREILLAAATTAQDQATGAYWHVKMTWVPNPNASAAEAAAMAAAGSTPPKWITVVLPNGKQERIRSRPGYISQINVATGKVRWTPAVPAAPSALPSASPSAASPAASPGKNLPVLNSTSEEWMARDGRFWTAQPACAAPPGTAVFEGLEGQVGEIALSDGYVDYPRAARLPTDPAALTAYLAKYETPKSALADALVTLLYDAVPPQVRAAAFRALAMFPGARNLGPVKGGQSLLIPFPKTEDPWIKLVVDPATSLVHSYATIKGTIVINTAAWTNQLPRVIPLPPKTACLPGH
jgi:hypothetical protein